MLELGGGARAVGVVLAAGLIPRAALTLVGGVWADRLGRRRVMLVADGVRCATQAAIAVLMVSGAARLWHLVVLVGLYGVATAFFQPALTGLVPQTIAPERLREANALLGISRSAAAALAPAASGLVVAGVGPGWAFAIDSATFAASVGALLLVRPRGEELIEASRPFLADLREGWAVVRSRAWLLTGIVYFSALNLAVAPVYVLGPIVSERSLGGASAWGLISTLSTTGFVVGGAAALRFAPRRPLLPAFGLPALAAAQLAALAFPLPLALVGAASLAATAGAAASNAYWFTTMQERVPPAALSRASAYDWTVSLVFQPLGFVAAGPVAAVAGTSRTLWIGAAIAVAASAAALALPSVRAVRAGGEEPAPAGA